MNTEQMYDTAEHIKLIREANLPLKKVECYAEDIYGADLSGLTLESAIFADCTLEKCNFNNCTLNGANFNSAILKDCTFTNCKFSIASFNNATAKNCNFAGADFCLTQMQFATFRETIFNDTVFSNTDIFETAFVSCPVVNADFTAAKNLITSVFSNLIGAKLPDWFCNIIPL